MLYILRKQTTFFKRNFGFSVKDLENQQGLDIVKTQATLRNDSTDSVMTIPTCHSSNQKINMHVCTMPLACLQDLHTKIL